MQRSNTMLSLTAARCWSLAFNQDIMMLKLLRQLMRTDWCQSDAFSYKVDSKKSLTQLWITLYNSRFKSSHCWMTCTGKHQHQEIEACYEEHRLQSTQLW
jgi:hypothetical protein